MLPEFPKFHDLEMNDLEKLKPFFLKAQPEVCELSLANTLIWSDFDRPHFTLINGNLCILINPLNEAPYFLEPLGSHKIELTVDTCLGHCAKLSRVSQTLLDKLPPDKYRVAPLRSQADYLYEVKTLAELKGRLFDGKRNHLKNFQRRHPDYQYVPLTCSLKNDCLEVFEAWFAARAESRYFPRLAYTAQKAALEEAFKYCDQLELSGGAIGLNGQVAGFMIGSQMNKQTIDAHFQYARPEMPGIFPALLWEVCNKTYAEYKYINLEQDLGIPGLRQSKLSYHPLRLVEKFELTPLPAASKDRP
jgi:uncharacterized protein